DEALRLRQYASSIAAGLDRVSMNERIATLEKAKTEFLNVASHELRGPMTVIKGYLTMLQAGSLGELSKESKHVLPLLIAKTDEGIVIAEEEQARLFRRFVRIETKTTERVSGSGLGLWLSREIARMHDGDLTVESTLGRGSTFTLQLPLNA